MISFLWLIPALMVGALVGIVLMCLMIGSKIADLEFKLTYMESDRDDARKQLNRMIENMRPDHD